jgi:hypothetical protein
MECDETCMGESRGTCRVLVGKPEGKRLLENLSTDRRMILNCMFNSWDGGMDCIYRAQDRDRWWALVSAVMNIQVP